VLFNSYEFLLVFAPITYIGFFCVGRYSQRLAALWLAVASVVFYSWWNPSYVPILMSSVIINYLMGALIQRAPDGGWRRLALAAAAGGDLAALGYFKYANFFVTNVGEMTGLATTTKVIALPLGISFFTFTQIAYLVDSYRGKATERNPVLYLLFVTYFPHLIAGPIIHHKDVMPQFARRDTYVFSPSNFVIGMVILILGLFKKCFLADGIAAFAGPMFGGAEQGALPDLLQAWGGALAYTFQLYFDFSGYSDMAIGLSLMINVRLPINFNSPYQAGSIIEFWKRWHISLSTFLRDYLYIPLGGNRCGKARRYTNLLATMVIGGLWHGAAWTFVAWGGLHGLYLIVNHAWRGLRSALPVEAVGRAERAFGTLVTFVAVVVAWVFFRATTFHGAASILAGMVGAHGVGLPAELVARLPSNLADWGCHPVENTLGPFVLTWGWCLSLMVVALVLPNTQDFVARTFSDHNYFDVRPHIAGDDAWRDPPLKWALGLGALAALALMNLIKPAEFLYFNF